MTKDMQTEAYVNLAFAVIEQALLDYKRAYRVQQRDVHDWGKKRTVDSIDQEVSHARATLGQVELFMHSPMYALACDADPDKLLEKLRYQVDHPNMCKKKKGGAKKCGKK